MNETPQEMNEWQKWLDEKYAIWCMTQPRQRRTLTRFAQYLGVSRESLNNYLGRGTKPNGDNMIAMAHLLGIEIYDVIGEERPEEGKFYILTRWSTLSEEQQRSVVDFVKGLVKHGESKLDS